MKIFKPIQALLFRVCLLTLCFSGCKKFVEIPPPVTAVTGQNVYNNDATATAVLKGVYIRLSEYDTGGGINQMGIRCGLSADELKYFGTDVLFQKIYVNQLSAVDYYAFWENSFTYLQAVNSVLEGLKKSQGLTPSVKAQLQGEALFVRAFLNFYLVNLYGDVPLVLSSDYLQNSKMARTSSDLVYKQIVSDLISAKLLLQDSYVDGNSNASADAERVRPNRATASALLARTYLFTGQYALAEQEAGAVIQDPKYKLEDLGNVFLRQSNEAIWQLMPVDPAWNTNDARSLLLTSDGPDDAQPFALNERLIADFESGDQRRAAWVDTVTAGGRLYYYPIKYKALSAPPAAEYYMVFRLAELYLIRAEARTELGNTEGAAADLNAIRARAGLAATPAAAPADLLAAVLKERRVELFTEWGHRWFDLKRTKQANTVLPSVTAEKGGTWDSHDQLYPLPLSDIKLNPALIQNPGY
ncbi:RagB/SusD domain-containing protein [Mucilaginibacter gracilis]|uniref:RagB/SusD domain-containing protein n=1 Tax=Mucilaginibacter gracilis TaxID=423350 RepID=A0A495IT99_9SPHI|nr:RagB/SusD family nutrient uptake outer membrane protein [Mucilaginibacter gracilis]RKR80006.1 RagB/SusD domain-containing protein [Mucilaginibacter gracilis]